MRRGVIALTELTKLIKSKNIADICKFNNDNLEYPSQWQNPEDNYLQPIFDEGKI